MIKFSNATQKYSNNLNKKGIAHQFAFGQITVYINLSPDNRVNEILADMVKKLAGETSEEGGMEIAFLINNNVSRKAISIHTFQLVMKFFEQIFLSSNRSRQCNKFCKKHNLNRYGIFPGIRLRASEEVIMSSNAEEIVNHEGVAFSFAYEKIHNVKHQPERSSQHSLETIKATPLISWYFENIHKLKGKELLWFMTNIVDYQIAKTEIRKLTKRNSRVAYYYKLAIDMYPKPLSYKKVVGDERFPCEYIYQAINSRLIPTMRIGKLVYEVTQEEISRRLEETQERFIDETELKIMLMRVDTGSGKTATIGDLFASNMAYVGPTHKLIKQFMADVQKWNPYIDIVYIPQILDEDIPECEYKEQMKYHEKRGEWKKASQFRRKAILEHGSPRQQRLLREYDEAMNKKDGSPFITHSRLINKGRGFFNKKRFENVDTIIIDEDILPSLFPSSLHSDSTVIKNIKAVLKLVEEDLTDSGFGVTTGRNPSYDKNRMKLRDALLLFIDQIKKAKFEGIIKNEAKNTFELNKAILSSYTKRCENITFDLFNVLEAEILTCKNHSQWPSTIYTQDYSHVLRGKKILLMSATLDKEVHLQLFRKRINWNTEWVDMPRTKIKGRIISHPDLSTTKSALTKNPERINMINEKIKEIGCIDHVITYKDRKNEIKNDDVSHMHFYNTAGYNDYSGRNLAIVGTPNNIPENAATLHYLIYGEVPKSLQYEKEKRELIYDLKSRPVTKDEFRFSFFTFDHVDDERARSIHLWSTYNELLQAVGRARLTHHDCEVHVFSRLPIPQCVFNYELA
ncbi:hypothetical protein J8N01_26005 [Priestia megaterium]|uniref:hypothetical protein n=1 Tax=Priestia megaterium TaxID=1404 RepID=UPI002377D3B2|nr:hypothetical protein [Priestia megaterium]WDM33695.1 hypothetical protein J8N01_26005 [Priestia megaterium]